MRVGRGKEGRAPTPPIRVRSISAPRFVESGRAAPTLFALSSVGGFTRTHSLCPSARRSVCLSCRPRRERARKELSIPTPTPHHDDDDDDQEEEEEWRRRHWCRWRRQRRRSHARAAEQARERAVKGGREEAGCHRKFSLEEGVSDRRVADAAEDATRLTVCACTQVAVPLSLSLCPLLIHSSVGFRGGWV